MSEFCEAKSPEFCEAKPKALSGVVSGIKNSLSRSRILCRGEFGAAVSEQRHSIRLRLSSHTFR